MVTTLKEGDKVRIKDNLVEVMTTIGFEEDAIERLKPLIGTTQTVFALWEDQGVNYATVDVCVEIPSDCCEVIQ